MVRRLLIRAGASTAIAGMALAATTVGATAAHASTDWHYVTTYLHYMECEYYGQQGVDNGSWSQFYCEPIDMGTNGPGNVPLYVRY